MLKKDMLLKMNVQKLFKDYPFAIKICENFGLKCNTCLFSKEVSLEEALQSSGLPSEKIVEEIIKYLKGGN